MRMNILWCVCIVVMVLYIIAAFVSSYISHKATVSRNKYIEAVHNHNKALREYSKALNDYNTALAKQNNLLKEILKWNAPLGSETQED